MLITHQTRKLSEDRPPQTATRKKDAAKCYRALEAAEEHFCAGAIRDIPMKSWHLIWGRGKLKGETGRGWALQILSRANVSTSGTKKRAIFLILSTFQRDIINMVTALVSRLRQRCTTLPIQSDLGRRPFHKVAWVISASCSLPSCQTIQHKCCHSHIFPKGRNGSLSFLKQLFCPST